MASERRLLYCLCILLASLVANVLLGWKLRARSALTSDAGLPIGSRIHHLTGRDSRGNTHVVRLDDGAWTLVHVVSPGCPYCAENEPEIDSLARQASRDLRFVGLSLGAASATMRSSPFPYLVEADAFEDMYGLAFRAVPQLVLFSPDGVAVKSWLGPLGSYRREYEDIVRIMSAAPQSRSRGVR
jgi:hypothetical protein